MPTKDGISGTGLPNHRMHTRRVWEAPTRRSALRARRESDLADVLTMLMSDHAKVDKLFKQIELLKKREDSSRYELVIQACEVLTVHLQLEEELFYPLAREEADETVNQGEVEHLHIRKLVNDLKALSEEDPFCDAKVKVLMDYVRHHVEQEETELFPALRKAEPDFTGLYEKMVKRREELEQNGMAAADLAMALTKENSYAPH